MSASSASYHSVNWVSWLHLAGELVANHAAVADIYICMGRDADWNRMAKSDYLARKVILCQ